MTNAHWERIKEVVHGALQLPVERRGSFVERACGSDISQRAEVESLLRVDAGIDPEFLRSPLFGGEMGGVLASGDSFEGRFLLTRQLGEGGMGQVWLAEQTDPVHRPVALKLIRAGMYDQAAALRFQAERQSLALMDHPCIAKVFEAGSTLQGQPYFVMEYVPGLSITEYCDRRQLGIRQRLELLMQACEGVQHAHQKAVIHRDLKPANILVVEVDGRPVPRIIDFGLAKLAVAKVADPALTLHFGQLMGTPGYVSPEQIDTQIKDIDTRTDVYSLGVILYELLCGQLPFETGKSVSLEEWLRQQRENEPPRPSARFVSARDTADAVAAARRRDPKGLLRQLRGDLDSITIKAIEKERDRRYGTPSELAADLRRFLADEPVIARPVSAVYQIRKFVRRNRVAAAVGAVVTLLAVVASGAGLIALRKEREAEFQTREALQAQSRLLTQAAAQHLKDFDVTGAQGILREVLTNPRFTGPRTPEAIGVFQKVRAADAQVAVLSGHGGWVYSVAPSPDGNRIVTASLDRTARIWDARTGAQLTVLSGHTGSVFCAAYSPDSARIVTASLDKTARIWDAHTGLQLATLAGHDERVYSAAYSPDGTRIVTASADRTARIWDARTGRQLTVLSGHGDYVRSAAYSPDGKYVVTASFDKTAVIWDAHTGVRVAALVGHEDRLYSAVYSPDGTRILTASSDRSARIWDARTAQQVRVLSGHTEAIFGAAYSSDGSRIVTAANDRTARTWDAQTGTQLAVLSGHEGSLYYAAYMPGSTRVVTASVDKTARVWEPQSDSPRVLRQDSWVVTAVFSADSKRVVTGSSDSTAQIWDAQTGARLAVLRGHRGTLYTVVYSADGSRIATASNDKTARVWDARTAELVTVLSGHVERVSGVAFSPDGAQVVTASADKTARIWDARTGVQLSILSGHREFVRTAVYSPDGTQIVTASDDMTARIWNARTGMQTAVMAGHTGRVYEAAYSSDGSHIVTASTDGTARIWDARTGAQVRVLAGGAGDRFNSARYSPDGRYVVTASVSGDALIWDARTGVQLAVLPAHGGALNTVAYSPDGSRIVTASDNNTARIWDARALVGIDAQIAWDAAAEIDPMPEATRIQLGLPPDAHGRPWPLKGTDCDQAAAALYDPERLTPGNAADSITVSIAAPTCSREVQTGRHAVRLDYELGRALFAQGDTVGARRELEIAVSRGYSTARVDLADLLVSAAAGALDPSRAVSLYEQAHRGGIAVAAFRLGRFYESEPSAANDAKAWYWYKRGADAGEPNSLARFAERAEIEALSQTDPSQRDAGLLQAFSLYAAATERARSESWPDDVWQKWRHRRATLARVLAKDGLMQQVADAYTAVLDKWSPVAERKTKS